MSAVQNGAQTGYIIIIDVLQQGTMSQRTHGVSEAIYVLHEEFMILMDFQMYFHSSYSHSKTETNFMQINIV